jgi:hypothetical protein
VVEMEKVVERLIQAFDEIRFDLMNNEIKWFNQAIPQIENCFVFIQKHAMSSRDLLMLFGTLWARIDPNMKAKEFKERLMLITRSDFIFSLSAVEFFLKLIIKESRTGPIVEWLERERAKAEKKERVFRIYLSGIMTESKRKKLINKSQHESWNGMIRLRNTIMHNNARVDEDTTFRIGEMILEIKEGEVASFPLVNYPEFVKILISLTRSWIEAYLKSHTL